MVFVSLLILALVFAIIAIVQKNFIYLAIAVICAIVAFILNSTILKSELHSNFHWQNQYNQNV